MFCNKCGKTIEDNSMFCTWCGARQPDFEQQDSGQSVSGQSVPTAAAVNESIPEQPTVAEQTAISNPAVIPAENSGNLSEEWLTFSQNKGKKQVKYYTKGQMLACHIVNAVLAAAAGVFAGLYFSVIL